MIHHRCTECDYGAHYLRDLRTHVENEHGENANKRRQITRNYGCTQCGNEYSALQNLNRHIKNEHSKNSEKYKCKHCDYAADDDSVIRRHEATAHTSSVHYCNRCNYSTCVSRSVETHIERMHAELLDARVISLENNDGKLPEFNIACSWCARKFVDDDALAHYFTHKHPVWATKVNFTRTEDGGFNCGVCGQFVSRKTYVSDHFRAIHLKEKRFECTDCDYTSFKANDFAMHLYTKHFKQPMYKCTKCSNYAVHSLRNFRLYLRFRHGEQSPNTSNLTISGNIIRARLNLYNKIALRAKARSVVSKRFKCHNCDKTFSSKSNFWAHNQSVHMKIKRHFCTKSDYATYSMQSFRAHVHREHNSTEIRHACTQCTRTFGSEKELDGAASTLVENGHQCRIVNLSLNSLDHYSSIYGFSIREPVQPEAPSPISRPKDNSSSQAWTDISTSVLCSRHSHRRRRRHRMPIHQPNTQI